MMYSVPSVASWSERVPSGWDDRSIRFSYFVLESRYSCRKVENFIEVIFLSHDIAMSPAAFIITVQTNCRAKCRLPSKKSE